MTQLKSWKLSELCWLSLSGSFPLRHPVNINRLPVRQVINELKQECIKHMRRSSAGKFGPAGRERKQGAECECKRIDPCQLAESEIECER